MGRHPPGLADVYEPVLDAGIWSALLYHKSATNCTRVIVGAFVHGRRQARGFAAQGEMRRERGAERLGYAVQGRPIRAEARTTSVG